jgi:succinyl-diaminopimelate desuccinylase
VRALRDAVARSTSGEVMSVGRDGASEAAAFITAGIPAVEFGPSGGGHHGPEEWVSLSSLARYRRSLGDFVRSLPMRLEEAPARAAPAAGSQALDELAAQRSLRAVEGGRP